MLSRILIRAALTCGAAALAWGALATTDTAAHANERPRPILGLLDRVTDPVGDVVDQVLPPAADEPTPEPEPTRSEPPAAPTPTPHTPTPSQPVLEVPPIDLPAVEVPPLTELLPLPVPLPLPDTPIVIDLPPVPPISIGLPLLGPPSSPGTSPLLPGVPGVTPRPGLPPTLHPEAEAPQPGQTQPAARPATPSPPTRHRLVPVQARVEPVAALCEGEHLRGDGHRHVADRPGGHTPGVTSRPGAPCQEPVPGQPVMKPPSGWGADLVSADATSRLGTPGLHLLDTLRPRSELPTGRTVRPEPGPA